MPDHVVFTVEYSGCSAQLAMDGQLDPKLKLPVVYLGAFDPRVLLKAFRVPHHIEV